MNLKSLAWLISAGCGLLGFGSLAIFDAATDSTSEMKSTAAGKEDPNYHALATPSLAGTGARKDDNSAPVQAQLLQQALDSKDPQEQAEHLQTLLADWTAQSPLSAAGFVQDMPDGILRQKALRVLAQTWGGQSIDEALNWSAALSDQAERDSFLTNACLGLAHHNPRAAVQIALQNNDQEEGLLENLTQQWAEKEAPDALSWVMQQPPGETRDQLLERVVSVESKTNPAHAASLVVGQMHPGSAQTEAALTVVHQWAERDWNSAAAWVDGFPDGSLRERAITELSGMARE